MHTLPAYESLPANPYQSPAACPEPYELPQEQSRGLLGWILRCLAYVGCGATLFVAFCTPLNLAQQMFWTGIEPNWIALGCVLVSSLLTGLLLDGAVRADWHPVLVGLLWAMANAVVFAALLLTLSDGPGRLNPERFAGAALMAIFFGPLYGILCLHLSLPISVLFAWLARQAK